MRVRGGGGRGWVTQREVETYRYVIVWQYSKVLKLHIETKKFKTIKWPRLGLLR